MIWLYLIPLTFLVVVCVIAIQTMIKVQKYYDKPAVKFEYQGAGYALEKGKTYLIKTKRSKFPMEELKYLSHWFEKNEIKAVFVGVEDLEDFSIELQV